MKKLQITILVALALATLILSGCGHSVSSTFTGKSINLGYNPNTGEVGIQYKDGTIIASATKENTTSNVEIDNSTTTDAEGTVSTSGVTKFSHVTGSQINGYFVEALEAGATVEELTGISPNTSNMATSEAAETDTAEVAEADTAEKELTSATSEAAETSVQSEESTVEESTKVAAESTTTDE